MAEKKSLREAFDILLGQEKTGYEKVFDSLGWKVEEKQANVPLDHVRDALVDAFKWKETEGGVVSQAGMKMVKLELHKGHVALSEVTTRNDFTMIVGPVTPQDVKGDELVLSYIFDKDRGGLEGKLVNKIEDDDYNKGVYDVVQVSSKHNASQDYGLAICERRGDFEQVRIFMR